MRYASLYQKFDNGVNVVFKQAMDTFQNIIQNTFSQFTKITCLAAFKTCYST